MQVRFNISCKAEGCTTDELMMPGSLQPEICISACNADRPGLADIAKRLMPYIPPHRCGAGMPTGSQVRNIQRERRIYQTGCTGFSGLALAQWYCRALQGVIESARGWSDHLRNGWPLAVRLEGFPQAWVVQLIQDVDNLVVSLVLIEGAEDLKGEAALGLLPSALDEGYNLQQSASFWPDIIFTSVRLTCTAYQVMQSRFDVRLMINVALG